MVNKQYRVVETTDGHGVVKIWVEIKHPNANEWHHDLLAPYFSNRADALKWIEESRKDEVVFRSTIYPTNHDRGLFNDPPF